MSNHTRPTLLPLLFFAPLCLLAALASPPASADAASPDRTEAAERFDRALRLVDDGDLSGGLAEFQRAYALVPVPLVLYNIGLVYAELHRPVQAARSLEQAITRPEALAADQAERARRVLHEQRDRIGQVSISANVAEGTVEIDNIEVAKWPLANPLDVAVGAHVVGVVSRGYAPARREVLLSAHDRADVALELVPIEGVLAHIAVRCRLPAADVLVDGARVGQTPLEATVTVVPGAHRVEVRRAGYIPVAHDVTLQDGALGELTFEPAADLGALGREGGWLAIHASETQSVARIDGEDAGLVSDPIRIPAGAHRLHLERAGFLEAERDVDVPVGGTARVSIAFEPTPETRVHYVASAESRHMGSWVTLGVGAAVAAGGVTLALVGQNQLGDARNSLSALVAAEQPGQPCNIHGAKYSPPVCDAPVSDAVARVNDAETLRTAGWIVAGAGAAVVVAGAVLLLTGDDPHRYDRRPATPLLSGWRFVPSVGSHAAVLSADAWF